MLDDNRAAVSTLGTAVNHPAITRGPDRRATRRGVIHPLVRAPSLQYRVPALGVVARAHAPKLDRATDEGAAFAVAFGIKIADLAVTVFVTHRRVGLATVGEFGGQDGAIVQFFAIEVLFLVEDAELVSGTYLEREVDVPAEDSGKIHDHAVREPGFLAIQKQRGFDDTRGRRNPGVDRLADLFDSDVIVGDRNA